ncbi:hypothetical protein [Polaribacter sp.]|uniref:hypothetical protein n=1 Tax=Polaribacter sp. TaxID=1920175 RepID=UPI003EF5A57B
MRKTIQFLSIGLIIFTFLSCGNETVSVPITFVFDKPLEEGKYPDYFKEIVTPFSANNCEFDYLMKPINVARLDIKKTPVETNAWYFEQMGDNTVEFSKNWLSQFYKDSIVDKHLTLPAKRVVSKKTIDSYLKKEEVLTLIYSEYSDGETYSEHTIFTSAKEISEQIKESICGNNYKEIIVLVNPSILSTTHAELLPEDETITTPTQNPCNQKTTSKALELKDDLLKIIDTKKSAKERDFIAKEVWAKYFDKNASVKMYVNLNDKYPDKWESGDGKNYLVDRLAYMSSIIDINITRVEFHRDTNKISSITTVECHNASEIQ